MSVTQATRQRRRLDFQTWDDVLADVEHLQRAGYDRAGAWDLSQIVDHVGEGLRTAQHGIEQRANWLIRKILGPVILKRILRDRRMKAGIKVPAWWLPGPTHDESAAVQKFRDEIAGFQRMTTQPFPHPFFGTMTKQQWNDLALIHAAHHFSFLIPRAA